MSRNRDYSLIGADARNAKARGLAEAEWYLPRIDRKTLKALMQRRDGPALRDTAIWFGLLLALAAAAIWLWGSWWAIPVLAAYGVLYGSASSSRWHEAGHGTAFRTPWMNDVLYQVAGFMCLKEGTLWRWSHARHHTDTIIVGRDREIAAMRPPNLAVILLNLLALPNAAAYLAGLLRHAAGRLSAEEQDFVPRSEWPRIVRDARITLSVHLAVPVVAVATQSWLPLLLVGFLPSIYGGWLLQVLSFTQHAGLEEDVLDHRLNTRTIHLNRVLRFLYWNMNYHIEHHMFPLVPYHRLPELHALLRPDLPEPYSGLIEAYREIVPAVRRQMHDPEYRIPPRPLPPTAQPYRPGRPCPALEAAE